MHRHQTSFQLYQEARQRRHMGYVAPFDYNQGVDLRDRVPNENELQEREDALLHTGIRVQTTVGFSYFTPDPLLVIYVDAWEEKDQPQDMYHTRFTKWTTEATSNPASHRHISIAYMSHLEQVENWQTRLANIFSKFNDQDVILIPYYISRGQVMYLDPEEDPIASDPDIQALHNGARDNLHVSM